VKFMLEVDIDQGAVKDHTADELGRILRYWAGNLKHYRLDDGDSEVIYDSAYAPVGSWRVTEAPSA